MLYSPTSIDRVIEQYIKNYNSDQFDMILEQDESFEVFYHLSEMRRSLFNWYDFKANASLLEIGGEYGALTGLFCERCSHVTCLADSDFHAGLIRKRCIRFDNLEILTGNLHTAAMRKYDYIILVGKLENLGKGSKNSDEYVRYLERLTLFLKDDGKLLIATENRYGIKYFCGERDPFFNKPFAGINHFANGSGAYQISRNELINIISLLPDMKYKLYYPVPDYKFAQLIYTDEYLPKNNLRERVVAYSRDASTLVLSEKGLYDDIIDNGVFPFFANSFLIECCRHNEFCKVKYAALSTDRVKSNSFATVITSDNFAEKRALYSEGESGLSAIMDNIRDLKSRGIAVVFHEQRGNKLVMPDMKLPTLSDKLKSVIKTNPEEFVSLLDLLYRQILDSSRHVCLSESECMQIDPDPDVWGIILEKAYIDMIPINCFYSNEKLIFFDQEFTRECFPANYVMFRALYYTYQFIVYADSFISLQDMKKRYGLVNKWDYYKQIERDFTDCNRNMKVNKNFWKWAKIDRKQMINNADRLEHKEQ